MKENQLKVIAHLNELGSISDEMLELQTKIHELHEKLCNLYSLIYDGEKCREK